MIYNTITEWLAGKISEFNNSLPEVEKLKKTDVNLDAGFLPSNMLDRRYLLKLSSISEDANETHSFTAGVNLEFHFTIFKRPLEYYEEIIDKYLFPLAKLLEDDTISGLEYESNGIMLSNIRELEITGLDKTDKGGKFILPSIRFKLEFLNS